MSCRLHIHLYHCLAALMVALCWIGALGWSPFTVLTSLFSLALVIGMVFGIESFIWLNGLRENALPFLPAKK